MPATISKMAKVLTDSTSVSAPGSFSLGKTLTVNEAYNYANTCVASNGINYPNVTVSSGTGISQPWFSNSINPKIKLDGEGADIEINGVSLMSILQERLNVMIPNPALEKEWAELKRLGDEYRKLEADLKEKARVWQALNNKS